MSKRLEMGIFSQSSRGVEESCAVASRLIDEVSKKHYNIHHTKSEKQSSIWVSNTVSLEVGGVDDSQWVSVHGKGSFASSPSLKEYVDDCLEKGCEKVVIDLEDCSAMDSTFMGTLAGLALSLASREGTMSVVGLSERNRDSLSDLGLAEILNLENEDGTSEWSERLDVIRGGLTPWEGESKGAAAAEEVLEAHQKLCDVNGDNKQKFGAVLEVLGQECTLKESS